MDKARALHTFWSGFGIPAYDENSVPDDAVMPYITYSAVTDSIGYVCPMWASVWYKSTSWEAIQLKTEEIAKDLAEHGHRVLEIDGGYIFVTKGTPFAQRLRDESDTIKRMYINIMAEYLTAY